MYRISIAPLNSIVDVAKKNSKSIGTELDFHTKLYEAGMEEILSQVAFRKLIECEIEETLPHVTTKSQSANERVINIFNQLNKQLHDSELKSLLLDLEAESNNLHNIESKQYFIQGFLEGYKFVKEI